MTAAEKREIKDAMVSAASEAATAAATKAVSEALASHAHCRFSAEEASLVHQLPRDLDRNSLILLGRVGRCLDSASNWIGRVVLISLVGTVIWILAKAIEKGWLKP